MNIIKLPPKQFWTLRILMWTTFTGFGIAWILPLWIAKTTEDFKLPFIVGSITLLVGLTLYHVLYTRWSKT